MTDGHKCPACGNDGAIKRRRGGGLFFECVSPCYLQGPTAATVDQALAGARRKAIKLARGGLRTAAATAQP